MNVDKMRALQKHRSGTISFVKLYEKRDYRGKFLALLPDSDKVVGYGKTPQQSLKQAKEKGCDSPVLTRIPVNIAASIL